MRTPSRFERQERELVVQAARSWVGTPYHHQGNVKGSGVDCAMLLVECYIQAGLIERPVVQPYTHDWHLHRSEERYLAAVEHYLNPVDDLDLTFDQEGLRGALPGDIVVWRIGRTYSHGAIVTQPDTAQLVHAYFPSRMVEEESLSRIRALASRPMRVYSFWR